MNLLPLTLFLIIERAMGESFIVIPFLAVILFNLDNEKLPKFSLVAGILIDIFTGHRLGISSLLLLISSFQISVYKKRIESTNIWSVFLLGLLVSVQAHIFWGISESISKYTVHGVTAVIIYLITKNISGKRNDGVYLKKIG